LKTNKKKIQKQIEKDRKTKKNQGNVKETSRKPPRQRQRMLRRQVFDIMRQAQDHLTRLCVGVRARLINYIPFQIFVCILALVFR